MSKHIPQAVLEKLEQWYRDPVIHAQKIQTLVGLTGASQRPGVFGYGECRYDKGTLALGINSLSIPTDLEGIEQYGLKQIEMYAGAQCIGGVRL